jgi:hypothetical protein
MQWGHEVFLDDERAQAILRHVSAFVHTPQACVLLRPSNRPSKQQFGHRGPGVSLVLSILFMILSM